MYPRSDSSAGPPFGYVDEPGTPETPMNASPHNPFAAAGEPNPVPQEVPSQLSAITLPEPRYSFEADLSYGTTPTGGNSRESEEEDPSVWKGDAASENLHPEAEEDVEDAILQGLPAAESSSYHEIPPKPDDPRLAKRWEIEFGHLLKENEEIRKGKGKALAEDYPHGRSSLHGGSFQNPAAGSSLFTEPDAEYGQGKTEGENYQQLLKKWYAAEKVRAQYDGAVEVRGALQGNNNREGAETEFTVEGSAAGERPPTSPNTVESPGHNAGSPHVDGRTHSIDAGDEDRVARTVEEAPPLESLPQSRRRRRRGHPGRAMFRTPSPPKSKDGEGNTTQNEQSSDPLTIEQSVKPSQATSKNDQGGPKTFEEMFGENESSVATNRDGGSSRFPFASIFSRKNKKGKENEDDRSSVNFSHTTGGRTFSGYGSQQ